MHTFPMKQFWICYKSALITEISITLELTKPVGPGTQPTSRQSPRHYDRSCVRRLGWSRIR